MADQYFRGLFITVLIAYKCHRINKQYIPQNSGFILILRCLLFIDKTKYSKNRLFRGLIFEVGLKKIVGNKNGHWTDYYKSCRKHSTEMKLRLRGRKQDGDRDTFSALDAKSAEVLSSEVRMLT